MSGLYKRLAVLVSGQGSLLEAMLEARLPVTLVVADRLCRGLEIATDGGIAQELVLREDFSPSFDRVAYTQSVVTVLQQYDIEFVAMAGFMTELAQPMFDVFGGRITNTHPSLLPNYKGREAVTDALADGATETGCTVQWAVLEVDAGPTIARETVDVLPDDTVASLHERIKKVERPLYARTLRDLIAN